MTAPPVHHADQLIASLFRDPAVAGEPYETYRELRRTAPVHRSFTGHWVLSRYADAEHVMQAPGVGKDVQAFIHSQGVPDWERHTCFTRMLDHLIWANPPVHTRRRSLVSKVFTPRAVAGWEPAIEARVAELLEPLKDGGEVDLLETFAFPLPVAVIGSLLGVPRADWPMFHRLIRQVVLCVEPSPSPAQLALADEAATELNAYFDVLIAERRAHPREDLISQLAAAEIDGDRLTPSELNSMVQFLFGAGFETTTSLIGNGMLALLRAPDQLERLRADESLLPGAVEELLRYDCSVQLTMRTAFEDLDISGTTVPAGESIVVLLGAANRDPDRYPDPDRLDLTRTRVRPMSFGGGIHYCIGAGLARLEGRIAFRELLRAFPRIESATERPSWRTNLTLHGLEKLPVLLSTR
ncbi:cytochrome P450 [Streptomyces sp. LHD-70]|uniref:cytochrome P450 n=1 Tax=Streptomyces sp. LHD-70 TaxID=3072140 RepID=UPI00280EE70C|nr:cytochrome P450 [Streptomyces sp. LHD-70]MDQ8705973.1 cytochrome P450 [Streptomyces sp. LHD-70]